MSLGGVETSEELRSLIFNGVDVQAFDSLTYEEEFIDKIKEGCSKETELDEREIVKKITTSINETDKPKSNEVINQAPELVRSGDFTPFELIIKRQAQLEKDKEKKKLWSKKSNKSEKQPKTSHSNYAIRKKTRLSASKISANLNPIGSTSSSSSDSDSNCSFYHTSDEFVSDYSGFSDGEFDEISIAEENDEGQCCRKEKGRGGNKNKIGTKSKASSTKRDDGDLEYFEQRIRKHMAEQEFLKISSDTDNSDALHELKDGHKVSLASWDKLYKYQKTGIRWLYELHTQLVGGILADEMGLGKTIQICVFFRSLAESQQESRIFSFKGLGPSLIVCPATVMHQWVRELHNWFPLCRVAVLHSSGAYNGPKKSLIYSVGSYRRNGSILITSYSTFTIEYKAFLKVNWHYVILDEGHKIRNPDAKLTLRIKELKTPHRVILTGSPMQNNLKELWSLIDFVYPGRLGSLQEFTEKIGIPITQGGYANATSTQVRVAYKCACILRDAISPYMLRRMKKDVQMIIQLPEKSEQVLFCDLTEIQMALYEEFLKSKDCSQIFTGQSHPFYGLIHLRKLCNHPDLITGGPNRNGEYNIEEEPNMAYGHVGRSGKMVVVKALLKLWLNQRQKVLIFSQSRQMLSILESMIVREGYKHLRMDGTTPIKNRQELVERFNNNDEIFIFLLTTRVGGLGVNLTGANRVLIYDPDWNPSTDTQARERAWRIGQKRNVTVYRLLTAGTIEEKIYQRQIFKHFLANRVLVDPKQQRFFKTNDLHELFMLTGSALNKTAKKRNGQAKTTETASIFSGTSEELNANNFLPPTSSNKKANLQSKSKGKKSSTEINEELDLPLPLPQIDEDDEVDNNQNDEHPVDSSSGLSPETIMRLRTIAKELSRKFVSEHADMINGANTSSDNFAKQNSLFDGRHEIPLLRRQKRVKTKRKNDESDAHQRVKAEKESKEQDDYVLGQLLKKAKVHSALRHDQIVGDGTTVTPDIQLIEDEAETVARRAAGVLKRSRRLHNDFLANAASPKKRALFGRKRAAGFETEAQPESGADLLSAIRARKEKMLESCTFGRDDANDYEDIELDSDEADEIQTYPSLAVRFEPQPFSKGDRFETLADEVRKFVVQRGGRVSTNDVLTRFRTQVTPADSYAFRSILKRLCRFCPPSQWVIRDEFA